MAIDLSPARIGAVPKTFAPKLTEEYRERLQQVVIKYVDTRSLAAIEDELSLAQKRARALRDTCREPTEIIPTHAYLTALLIVRDLIGQGYEFELRDGALEAVSPSIKYTRNPNTAPEDVKRHIRQSYQFARKQQLNDPPTAAFIRSMERRGVLRLVADGSELSSRVEPLRNMSVEERRAAFRENAVMRPVLQLVEPGARDEFTGLQLQDIWRYFRHYWSIPYQTQPGRNMFYLVRDTARPTHSIIGIAALGNAPIQLSVRDNWVGWSLDRLSRSEAVATEQGDSSQLGGLASALFSSLQRAIAEVRTDDLIATDTLVAPTEGVVNNLRRLAQHCAEQRIQDLRAGESRELSSLHHAFDLASEGRFDEVDWRAISETFLYRWKRARLLADLLYAYLRFLEAGIATDPERALSRLLERDAGRRAVRIALHAIKTERVGTSIMELTVCGAIPPYSYLLGGKLVAMLMASPQVYRDYERRYGGQPSYIASTMKGEPVLRPAKLVLLEVTNLYHIGSSQYNRLRVPAQALERGRTGEVRFVELGLSESFGTIHFTPQTTAALALLAELKRGARDVNYIFGEGHSPRLRKIRAGLDALCLNSEAFLRHDNPRIVYAVPLAQNALEYLMQMDDEPSYILPTDDPIRRTMQIADYWATRWLASRLQHEEVIGQVASFSPWDLALSREIVGDETSNQESLFDYLPPRNASSVGASTSEDGSMRPGNSVGSWGTDFLTRLYRSLCNQADHLMPEQIDAIHIPTTVDDFIRHRIRSGFHLVITGNPGDGKTHLVRRLKADLQQASADIIEDANEVPDEEIIKRWREAINRGVPFCLAINEGPLFALLSKVRESDPSFPEMEEAWRQVRHAVYYHPDDEPPPATAPVQVVDLGLRNVLTGAFVKQCLERLTDDAFFVDASPDSPLVDPALWNRARLGDPRVQERLFRILEGLGRRGHHTTMRQLLGFLAYLLVGGKTQAERLRTQGDAELRYFNLAYSGDGELFDAVRSFFDPATVSHPSVDETLWSGGTDPADWLPNGLPPAPENCQFGERESVFYSLKRRYYFEHVAGDQLLKVAPSEDAEFQRLLCSSSGATHDELVERIILALNRFYVPTWNPEQEPDLYLWTSHRYHADVPKVFIANQRVGLDKLEIGLPHLASWVKAWIGDMYVPDHFAVISKNKDQQGMRAVLRVDFELYCTLKDAATGLMVTTWSRNAARRIANFVDHLRRIYVQDGDSERLRAYLVEGGKLVSIRIRRQPEPRYVMISGQGQ